MFVLIPATRDFPWANLLLFGLGLALIAVGLDRAFRRPEQYRGKVAGSICAGAGGLLLVLFVFGIFFLMRQVPDTAGVVKVGQHAPDFTLPDQDGKPVALAQLLAPDKGQSTHDRSPAALLIFYRGYW